MSRPRRRDLLVETLDEAAVRMADASLALRAGKPEHAHIYIREALRKLATCTSDLRENPRKERDS